MTAYVLKSSYKGTITDEYVYGRTTEEIASARVYWQSCQPSLYFFWERVELNSAKVTFFWIIYPDFAPKEQEKTDLSRYPHKCPTCQSPAYVGFSSVECSKECAK
jgi:hypothetical protein